MNTPNPNRTNLNWAEIHSLACSKYKHLLALFVLLSTMASAAPRVAIPDVDPQDLGPFYVELVREHADDCAKALIGRNNRKIWTVATEKKIRKIIRFANSMFQRRDWSAEFIAERLRIALNYITRSRYVAIREGASLYSRESDPIVGSIGLTVARYGNGEREILPFEELLKVRVKTRGKGMIFEMRTYAKDKVRGATVFPLMLSGCLEMLFEYVKESPELYDQPVLYLYGDDLSVRFYQALGFDLVKDIPPINYDGTEWKVMVGTPKEIESKISKLKGTRYLRDLNQPTPVTIGDGRTLLAAPHSTILIKEGFATRFSVNQETEMIPGVFAAKGSEVLTPNLSPQWYGLYEISRPVDVPQLGIQIPVGSSVTVNGNHSLLHAEGFKQDVFVPDLGITIPKGGGISLKLGEPKDRVIVTNAAWRRELMPSLPVGRYGQVTFEREAPNKPWRRVTASEDDEDD